MRVSLYQHFPEPIQLLPYEADYVELPGQAHMTEFAWHLRHWGHTVECFANMVLDGQRYDGLGNFWKSLEAFNPATPEVIILYGARDLFVQPRGVGQVRCLVSKDQVPPPTAEEYNRFLAVWNADLYTRVGGTVVSDFGLGRYRHPNHFIYGHRWEQDSRAKWFRPNRDQVILDIGSAIGSWTLPAAACGATVYAFDPGTDALTLFRLVRENGFEKRVTISPQLVSDHSGHVVKRADIPWSSVPAEGDLGDTTTLAIDDFVDQKKLERVDFIKIDTDGGELKVLAGMKRTLERFHPALIVEVHTFLGVTHGEVVLALAERGYNAFETMSMEDGYYLHLYATKK